MRPMRDHDQGSRQAARSRDRPRLCGVLERAPFASHIVDEGSDMPGTGGAAWGDACSLTSVLIDCQPCQLQLMIGAAFMTEY